MHVRMFKSFRHSSFIVALAILVVTAYAQTTSSVSYPVVDSETYSTASSGNVVYTGNGIGWHTIAWIPTGASGCTVKLMGSYDGSTFTTPLIPQTGTESCNSPGVAQIPVLSNGSQAIPIPYVQVQVTALSAGTVQVTYIGYTGNPYGAQTYGMPVVQGLGTYQTSNAAIYVSAFNGGMKGCSAINYAISHVFFPGQTVVVDLQGDQPCQSNPIPSTCMSTVFIGPGANYHVQSSSAAWVIPSHCKIIFNGQGTSTDPSQAASVVSACNSAHTPADPTCGSNTFIPTSIDTSQLPLVCFGTGGTCGATSPNQFDSVIIGGTFDCEYVDLCIDIQNVSAQENSGVFGSALIHWGNDGVALDLGTNSSNSTAEHLNISNESSSGGSTTCTVNAVGIRINGSVAVSGAGVNPRKVSDVTISNSQCSSSTRPNHLIQIAGDGSALSSIHLEYATVAGIDFGTIYAPARSGCGVSGCTISPNASSVQAESIDIREVTCTVTPDCVRIESITPVVNNLNLTSILCLTAVLGGGATCTNTIDDFNAVTTIVSSSHLGVSHYVTDQNGNIYKDSSYVNAERVSGVQYATAANAPLNTIPVVTVANTSVAYTATPALGASGTLGSITMGNATTGGGTLTVEPTTGSLGTVTQYIPVPPSSPGTLTQTIAAGTARLATSLIAAGACAAASAPTITTTFGTISNVLGTDDLMADFNADPTGTAGYSASSSGMLTIIKFPTNSSPYVNFRVCNNTGSSITPGSVTLNWRVVR